MAKRGRDSKAVTRASLEGLLHQEPEPESEPEERDLFGSDDNGDDEDVVPVAAAPVASSGKGKKKKTSTATSATAEVTVGAPGDDIMRPHVRPHVPPPPPPTFLQPGSDKIPGMDGKTYNTAEFKDLPWGGEWRDAMLAIRARRLRDPYYKFMDLVAGAVSGSCTVGDFDAIDSTDLRRVLESHMQQRAAIERDIVRSRIAAGQTLAQSMSNEQNLRMVPTVGPNGQPQVGVTVANPAATQTASNPVNADVRRARNGSFATTTYGDMLQNIVTSQNAAVSMSMPELNLVNAASSIDWINSGFAGDVQFSSTFRAAAVGALTDIREDCGAGDNFEIKHMVVADPVADRRFTSRYGKTVDNENVQWWYVQLVKAHVILNDAKSNESRYARLYTFDDVRMEYQANLQRLRNIFGKPIPALAVSSHSLRNPRSVRNALARAYGMAGSASTDPWNAPSPYYRTILPPGRSSGPRDPVVYMSGF